jgi:hypothetical protein
MDVVPANGSEWVGPCDFSDNCGYILFGYIIVLYPPLSILFIISSSLATCLGAKFHNIIECGWIY